MDMSQSQFLIHFSQLKDPRLDRKKRHGLLNIIAITAIPELLKDLTIQGCLVTIDAMGCQRQIAQDIVDAGADYLLAVKDNQETLRADVEEEFKSAQADRFAHMDHEYYETLEKGHGRIEQRRYWYTHDVAGLGTLERWPF